jgi:hypothetical protein
VSYSSRLFVSQLLNICVAARPKFQT